jgi:hypothetical protein
MKKSISTEANKANIAKVLDLLAAAPQMLVDFSKVIPSDALRQPLKLGERSFIQIIAHILNCEERTTESIYAALLLHEPLILNIHPERQWGALLRYEQLACAELLAYFSFRRKALLRILNGLTDAQWGRVIREEGKQRKESIYWRARGMALHEAEHLNEIESRLDVLKAERQ